MALAFAGLSEEGLPEFALAVEVAEGAGELIEVIRRARTAFKEAASRDLPSRQEGDVKSLPDLSVHAVSLSPPAGGLFPDSILVVRTEPFEGYWKLLEKVAGALGGDKRALELSGVKVENIELLGALFRQEDLLKRLFEGDWESALGSAVTLTRLGRLGSATRADLPGGWTVFSALPQAVVRYVKYYAKREMLAGAGDIAALARKALQRLYRSTERAEVAASLEPVPPEAPSPSRSGARRWRPASGRRPPRGKAPDRRPPPPTHPNA